MPTLRTVSPPTKQALPRCACSLRIDLELFLCCARPAAVLYVDASRVPPEDTRDRRRVSPEDSEDRYSHERWILTPAVPRALTFVGITGCNESRLPAGPGQHEPKVYPRGGQEARPRQQVSRQRCGPCFVLCILCLLSFRLVTVAGAVVALSTVTFSAAVADFPVLFLP